jgi:hypothetical protein
VRGSVVGGVVGSVKEFRVGRRRREVPEFEARKEQDGCEKGRWGCGGDEWCLDYTAYEFTSLFGSRRLKCA